MATLYALSTEYLRYLVTAQIGGTGPTFTTDTVQFAFPVTSVQPSTWFAGSWETIAGSNYARILVGPNGGTTSLAAGTYDVWIKITDNPEIPVRKAGTLTVS